VVACLGDMNADGVIISAPCNLQNLGLPPITTGFVCDRRDGFSATGRTTR
jgi:hypothetical protein